MNEPTTKERNWVWYSSVESAAAGKISVLAVTETLMLTAAGFYAWLYHGWFWHLVFGLVVAPLFYLRTKESTDAALRWGEKALDFFLYQRNSSKTDYFAWFLFRWIALTFFSSLSLAVTLHVLDVQPFWIGIAAGVVGASVGSAAGFRTKGGDDEIVVILIATEAAIAAATAVATGADKMAIGFGIAAGSVALSVGEIGTLTITKAISATVASTIIFHGHAWGIFLVLFAAKIGVSTRHLLRAPLSSLRQIPKNWHHHHFTFDTAHPPEILPNAEQSNFRFCFNNIRNVESRNISEKIGKWAYLSGPFIPAFLFRYSMKSGAWLWLPLVWLLQEHDGKDDDAFLRSESTEFLAHLKLVYA